MAYVIVYGDKAWSLPIESSALGIDIFVHRKIFWLDFLPGFFSIFVLARTTNLLTAGFFSQSKFCW